MKRPRAAFDVRLLISATLAILVASPLLASRAHEIGDLAEQLKDARRQVEIHGIPLTNGDPATLEVEPFEVWAPNAKIVVHGDDGSVREIDPPARRYFKGRVRGVADSIVFLSADRNDTAKVDGIIISGETRFVIGRGRRLDRATGTGRDREGADGPLLVGEIESFDELLDPSLSWTCAVEKLKIPSSRLQYPANIESLKLKSDAGSVPGATYTMTLALETDFELYQALGSPASVTAYLSGLIGAASVIYQRDLATTLLIGTTHIWSTAADPWTVTPPSSTGAALAEFGTYWHNNYAADSRSAVVFISGKLFSGGVAWFHTLCRPASGDTFCGADGSNCGSSTFANAYAGAYAFCANAGSVSTTTPDPNATVNGVQYGVPSSNFWMLLETAHELGHTVGGDHTQCVSLTAAEKTTYSIGTTYPDRNFVDECYNADGGTCFGLATSGGQACSSGYCPGGVPIEKGTIMSYCHNIGSGGFRQSRYLFGKIGEASFKMLGIFNTAFESSTPNGSITMGAQPLACTAGLTASIQSCAGCTYAWQITGGSITSSSTTSSITFTPSGASVTLTATITSSMSCKITTSSTRTTSCASIAAPTNVAASASSATSVSVAWTAAAGATKYHVYRSSNGTTYTQVNGESTTGTSYSDTGLPPNTAYLYRVRSVDGSNSESGDSNRDLATTIIFTDDPLNAGTPVKAVHVTQLRTAVNAVRALAAPLTPSTFTDPTVNSTIVLRRLHVTELRSALDAARNQLVLSALSYTDSTIVAGSTLVRAAHLTDLRNGVK